MKKLIFLIAFMGTFSMAFAQHNIPYEKIGNVSATVITPFSIWDITPHSNPVIGDVINGQKRVFATAVKADLFQMQKETMHYVRLQLRVPQPVDGVTITAHWFFTDTPPSESGEFTNPLDQDFDWYGTQTDGWITILVYEIDATHATSIGTKSFTASATGWYTDL
jgi:hypothetical protein